MQNNKEIWLLLSHAKQDNKVNPRKALEKNNYKHDYSIFKDSEHYI